MIASSKPRLTGSVLSGRFGASDALVVQIGRVEHETGDKHTATDWKSAPTTRDAFKQEAERIRDNGGPKSDDNYNKIESPERRYSKTPA